jgi:hypothetical protein
VPRVLLSKSVWNAPVWIDVRRASTQYTRLLAKVGQQRVCLCVLQTHRVKLAVARRQLHFAERMAQVGPGGPGISVATSTCLAKCVWTSTVLGVRDVLIGHAG